MWLSTQHSHTARHTLPGSKAPGAAHGLTRRRVCKQARSSGGLICRPGVSHAGMCQGHNCSCTWDRGNPLTGHTAATTASFVLAVKQLRRHEYYFCCMISPNLQHNAIGERRYAAIQPVMAAQHQYSVCSPPGSSGPSTLRQPGLKCLSV